MEPKRKISGRNNAGRITVRHRGGAHKRHYRVIDFKRTKMGFPAKWNESSMTQIGAPISR